MASTSSLADAPTPDASLVLFARGVIARLATWQTLRLAVDESWGGPESSQKQTWMASVVVDAFETTEQSDLPDAIYLEEVLLQIMADEFDVILEDGSAESVARDIMSLWEMKDAEERIRGAVAIWEDQANKLKGKKVASREVIREDAEVDGSSDEWEDEDQEGESDEAPKLLSHPSQARRKEPQVDEEGFTTVTKRSKSHG